MYVTEIETRNPIARLEGYQPGEHFGASLSVTDINGDGKDDIIIGAPHHTDYENPQLKYEIGAVYIYYQTDLRGFQRGSTNELILKGQTTGGRFGFAVAALGDTNQDGNNDIAVGAPYENEGSGTVYIYHGSRYGLKTRPGQIISGDTFTPKISSFGFSFSTTVTDFDENKYFDVFVGAYQSDVVVYLPARPVVKVTAELTFEEDNLVLNKKGCDLPSSRMAGSESLKVACTSIKYCLGYSGINVPGPRDFTIQINLDVNVDDPDSRRLLFLVNGETQLSEERRGFEVGKDMCFTHPVYAKSNIKNIVTSVQSNMTIQLNAPKSSQPTPGFQLLPILDVETTNFISNFMTLSDPEIGNNSVPWWVYLVSILGAILILGTIAGVLYKVNSYALFTFKVTQINLNDIL